MKQTAEDAREKDLFLVLFSRHSLQTCSLYPGPRYETIEAYDTRWGGGGGGIARGASQSDDLLQFNNQICRTMTIYLPTLTHYA